jgi:Mrp family chromosome partitioning ATPase/LPS O-antigen subunit length determinant protein (WzzB/FepE family)
MQDAGDVSQKRLGDYFVLLRRQWLAVLICLLLGVGLAVAYMQLAPKQYRTTTSVLVTETTPSSSGVADRSTINLDTEAQLVTATQTVTAAAKTLGVTGAAVGDLGGNVSVSVPPNTDILDITYTGGTARDAQRGSLAFAQAYLAQRQQTAQASLDAQQKALQTQIDALNAQLQQVIQSGSGLPANSPEANRVNDQAAALNNQLTSLGNSQNQLKATTVTPGQVVTQPGLPTSPSSPKGVVAITAGVILGLLAGIGVAALRHRADDVVRTPDDLFRRTRVPVATVLSTRLHAGEVGLLPPLSADGRGYARLRNLVTTSLEETTRRVVLVAGVRRGSGPVAANLAASLARAGEDVFLVCGDVFGSTATAVLGDEPAEGLGEVLAGEREVEDVVRRLPGIPGLRIIGPGRDADRADALLQTRSPRRLIDELLESGAYVVIEAPPTRDSPDAQTLANVAELAVLVVEAGDTSAHDVLDACAQLESVHTAVLGAVIARYGRDSTVDRRSGETADEPRPDTGAPGASGDADAAEETPEATATDVADAEDRDADEKVPSGAAAAGGAALSVPTTPGVAATQEIPAVGSGSLHVHDDDEQSARSGGDVVPTSTRPALVPPTTRGPAPR